MCGADHRCSCMVRLHLEMVEDVNTLVAEAR